MAIPPTKEEWLHALAEVEQPPIEGALTLLQLRALWNRGAHATKAAIHALIAAGKAKEVSVMTRDTTGRRHRTRAFLLLP